MSSEAFCTRADSHADRTIPRNPYSRENFPQLFDMPKPADILLPRGGKLGAGSPVFAKEFLAQNGLGTELLREVGVPKVGHHVFGIWFRIEGDQNEPFVWFGDGVWCCVRDEWCCGSS